MCGVSSGEFISDDLDSAHPLRREVAEVLLQQPRARRAEGLGRTTKQLGCVRKCISLSLSLLVVLLGWHPTESTRRREGGKG